MGLGLPTELAAAIYGFISLLGALWLIKGTKLSGTLEQRILIFWALLIICRPLINDSLLILLLFSLALPFLKPGEHKMLVPMFIACAWLFPKHVSYQIPFPGLNYLIQYELWMMMVFVLLVPVFWANRYRMNSTDFWFWSFLLLVIALEFREVTLTEGLRRAFVTTLYLGIPYVAISRSIRTWSDLAPVFRAALLVAVVFATLIAVSTFIGWDLGDPMRQATIFSRPEYRFGFQRMGATTSAVLSGYIAALGIIILLAFNKDLAITKVKRNILLALLMFAVFVTGTRAAWAGAFIVLAAYLAFTHITLARFRMMTIIGIACSGIIMERVLNADFSLIDQHGTFEYRQQLLQASLIKIQEDPLFGDPRFLESPLLDHLVQGQGIIDIVNRYLQIALEHGLAALGLFLLAHLSALDKLVGAFASQRARHTNSAPSKEVAIVFSFSIAYLFLLATFSDGDHVQLFGAIFLGLARGIAGLSEQSSMKLARANTVSAPGTGINVRARRAITGPE